MIGTHVCDFVTGDENIYKKLHSHFTWMLKTGGLTFTETLYTSQDLLKKLQPNSTRRTIFDENACSTSRDSEAMPLRALENLLSKQVFRILLYCLLVGIKVSKNLYLFTKSKPIYKQDI